jgi:phosphocarrier protein FPr
VLHVHRAGHALTLAVSGLEILIHVGLDTVKLNGTGFDPRVKAGDDVRAGDLLLTFDADYIATHARSLITPVVVTNMERVEALQGCSGRVTIRSSACASAPAAWRYRPRRLGSSSSPLPW